MFITFEGPDGSGKSLQAANLETELRAAGHGVTLTREPGGTEISDQIRKVLMRLENTGMDPRTEFLLFSASRAQHVKEVIQPALDAGQIVLCDRFFDSSFAYQGYGQGLELEMLRAVTHFATGGLVPDLTLLFDIDAEEGLKRRERGGDWNRLDAYDLAFHTRVREGYHALVAAEPARWVVIDASLDPESVQAQVSASVRRYLAARG